MSIIRESADLRRYGKKMIKLFIVELMISLLQYIVLELSCREFRQLFEINFGYFFIGVCTIAFVNMLFLLIVGKFKVAVWGSSLLNLLFAIINFYVYKLHGTPFTVWDIKNIGTAKNVMSSYSFEIEPRNILMVCLIGILLLFSKKFLGFYKEQVSRIVSSSALCVMALIMCVCYMGDAAFVPRNVVGWSWDEGIQTYGYLPCFVQMTKNSFVVLQEPEDYNLERVKEFTDSYVKKCKAENTPDIILVLNETFYDLNQITDVQADQEQFATINQLDNVFSGYAITPYVGGTNNSEYELLTSNSLFLMPTVGAAFNDLDMDGANSIVSYLESIGYTTFGGHSEPSQNYSRQAGYSGLGFDFIKFAGDYQNLEYYYDRFYETDECIYNNLFTWYEQMGEGPRFMYTLTIQNHGGYEMNDAKYDTIHTQKDYGDYTDDINEFMTSISLSDKAFGQLVDYFSKVDRDVIICMVGDHAPDFAKEIVDENYSDEKEELRLRSVPFLMWSNNRECIDTSVENVKKVGMTQLVPLMLKWAGVEMSNYYDYIYNMSQQVPIITAYNKYVTASDEIYSYDQKTEWTELIDVYFDLEYTNIEKNCSYFFEN